MFSRSRSQKHPLDGLGISILFPPRASDQEAIVDIVFVHGLGGSRYKTWKKKDVLWPKQLLGEDFPRARVMTWGYDADVIRFFGPVGQGNIQDHAKTLNRDLLQERFADSQASRPIIFITHSLGGLVVKDALFLSYREGVKEPPAVVNQRLAAIKRSTKGILFAGTPHRGADKAKWATTAAKLAECIQKDHSRQMLDTLKRGSETLERLQDSFKDIIESFAIYTLLEELPYPKLGKIVEKDSALIGWRETEILIHANHSDMVKFADRTDNDYKKVRFAIQEIVTDHIEKGQSEFQRNSRSPRHSSPTFHQQSVAARNTPRFDMPVEQPINRSDSMSSPLEESSGAQMRTDNEFSRNMELGRYFLNQDRNLAHNLVLARTHFTLAKVLPTPRLAPSDCARVCLKLSVVEMQMSFHRDLTLRGKTSHLQAAESHIAEAFACTINTPTAENKEIELQHALLKGRRAEVESRMGRSPEEVHRQKSEAIQDITVVKEELRRSTGQSQEQNLRLAAYWQQRLGRP